MATKKISELPAVSAMYESDLFIISQGSGSTYGSLKATLVGIAKKILTSIQYASELQTSDKTITGAINELNASTWKDVTGTLTAGSTSITIQDSAITTSSTIDIYTSKDGIYYTSRSVATGQITIRFNEAQNEDVTVKVRIS